MQALSMSDIAKALGKKREFTEDITHICTDTREITQGCLFIALKGENFNGHDFIKQALKDGALYAVADEGKGYPRGKVIKVKNTRQALLSIASLYRQKINPKVVGVTGSVGKTTSKEMIACVLQSKYKTLKNLANLNNEVGLSQTVLQLEPEHEAAVLEMGMDAPGEISPLSRCAMPDVGVVTNIGVSHLEKLGSRENILKEKISITDGIKKGGSLVICGDDDMLATVKNEDLNIVRYGINGENLTVKAQRIHQYPSHTTFEIVYDQQIYDAQIPSMGKHNVLNALAAFSVGILMDISPQEAIVALRDYKPAGMRQNVVVHNNITVVEDCYNASPDSMHAAIETLSKLKTEGRKIMVLSDMLELGEISEEAHFDIGVLLCKSGIDMLLAVGNYAFEYVRGAKDMGMENARCFDSKDSLFLKLKSILKPGDTVWFKASRGMKLEDIITRVYREC